MLRSKICSLVKFLQLSLSVILASAGSNSSVHLCLNKWKKKVKVAFCGLIEIHLKLTWIPSGKHKDSVSEDFVVFQLLRFEILWQIIPVDQ